MIFELDTDETDRVLGAKRQDEFESRRDIIGSSLLPYIPGNLRRMMYTIARERRVDVDDPSFVPALVMHARPEGRQRPIIYLTTELSDVSRVGVEPPSVEPPSVEPTIKAVSRAELQHRFEQKAPIPSTKIERFAGTYRFKPTLSSSNIGSIEMWELKTYVGMWEGFRLAMDIVTPTIFYQYGLLNECRKAIKVNAPSEKGLLERLKIAVNTTYMTAGAV